MKLTYKTILLAVTIVLSFGISAQTNGTFTFTATTINQFGTYQPKNIMAIWVTNSSGTFVKTLKKMAGQRVQYLYQWKANSASNVTDAITGATLSNHQTHTVTWNCKNVSQVLVPDGDYKVWIEFTDGDYQGAYTSFTWTKNATAQTLTPTNSKLSGVSLTWTPTPSSVSENPASPEFSVYPNPFSNQLNFVITNSTDRISIDIYDISGRKVAFLERNSMGLTTNIITWNGTSANGERLKTGVYFYQITMGDKKYTGKVLLSN
jgi:flagellar hook assembly protein FlgD